MNVKDLKITIDCSKQSGKHQVIYYSDAKKIIEAQQKENEELSKTNLSNFHRWQSAKEENTKLQERVKELEKLKIAALKVNGFRMPTDKELSQIKN